MIEKIINASKGSYHAQRNWDRTKTIPKKHIDTLLEVIKNSPTKQAETHYKVFWSDDQDFIYQVYRKTKHFAVTPKGSIDYTDSHGRTEVQYNVRNSQIYSNLLFAFSYDWKQEESRTLVHAIVDEGKGNSGAAYEKQRQKNLSIGIAVGELILAANLLGYKTGLCSAFWQHEMKEDFFNQDIELLVGVGYPTDKPRTEHEEVYNKDIVAEDRRTGADDEKWLFPAFTKKMTVTKM